MEKKKCSNCFKTKKVTEFSFRRKDAKTIGTRYQAYCKECYSENHRRLYKENPEKYGAWAKDGRKARVQKLFDYLRDKECQDCGNEDSRVLEFDHRNPETKVDEVSNLIRSSSWKKTMAEIKKCDIVCANCHKLRTIIQRDYYKDLVV